MDSAPDINTVHQAITTLYGQDGEGSVKASVWLGEFQKSLFAWEISDKLLAERRDETSCYFAAQTMRTKIQYSYHELPQTSYESLRSSLLQHALASSSFPSGHCRTVVSTQLALALVDLYLQTPVWHGFVSQLITQLAPSDENGLLLLNILKVFPEENQSDHLRLGANRREEIWDELAKETAHVMEFVSSMCVKHSVDEEMLVRSFGCLSSWLLNPLMPTEQLAQSQLLQSIMQLLASPTSPSRLHESATDCIAAALYKAEDTNKHGALAVSLYAGVRGLNEAFHMCVAQEDCDKLQNYARLFTELAESLIEPLVNSPGRGLGEFETLELLLLAIGYHDYSLAEMTFNVWYRLSEYIYRTDSDELTQMFRPYIQRLIAALYKHCRFDADYEGTPDENEDFSEFRARVTEVIKDVVFIAGADNCFKQMFDLLKSHGPSATWDETEAALYIMTAVAKNIIPDEEEIVPQVLEAVLQLPTNAHLCLRYTAIRLLGQLNEWIDHNAQYCERIVHWLLTCIQTTQLAAVGAESLEFICVECRQKLVPHIDLLVRAVTLLDELPPEKSNECAVVALHRACAVILCNLPSAELSGKLNQICSKQKDRLNQLISSKPESNNENDPGRAWRDPVIALDRLAAVFRNLNCKHIQNGDVKPWLPVIQEIWPVLSETCAKFESNVRVVEHCCRTIRFAIRSLGLQSFPFIEPLVKQMVDIYQRQPHSCFLYLGSILVDEYGCNENFVPGLLYMLQSFTGPTFKLLDSSNGLTNHPDTVDDLFRLGLRFVQKSPAGFFPSECSRSLWQCGLAAIYLDHQDANKSVSKFFTETVEFLIYAKKKGISNPGVSPAQQLLTDLGANLVQRVVQAALFHLSKHCVKDMAEILFVLTKFCPEVLAGWLESALKDIPNRGGLSATNEQLLAFHTQVIGARDLRSVSGALRDLIRLYR